MAEILALKVDRSRPIRRGSAYMWSVVRELTKDRRDRVFTLADILAQTNSTELSTVRKWARTLAKAGILEEVDGGFRCLKRPTMLPHLSNAGEPVPSRNDAMWAAMRALKSFSPRELALVASTEEAPVKEWTAKSYTVLLNAAGYLVVTSAATPRKQATYRLKPSKNTGPLAPRILRTKLVYDPNLQQVMGEAEAEEVDP